MEHRCVEPECHGQFVAQRRSREIRVLIRSMRIRPLLSSRFPSSMHLPHLQTAMAGFFFDNPYRATFEDFASAEYRASTFTGQYTNLFSYWTADEGHLERLLIDRQNACYLSGPWEIINAAGSLYGEKCWLAELHREKQIPCDTLWLDIDHMDGYRVFTWNPAFP